MNQPARRTANTVGLRSPRRGLTMVDALCSLMLAMVLLAGVLPLFDEMRARVRLESLASLLETDIHFGRSTAISKGVSVRMAVQSLADGGSCYVMYTGPAQACTCSSAGQAQCEGDGRLLRVEAQAANADVTLAPLSRTLVFDAFKGTVTPTATVQLIARDGRSLHQVVNIMGRVRTCTPSGALPGVRRCA